MKKLVITFLALFFATITFEYYLKFSPYSYGVSPVEYDAQIGMWHKKKFTGRIVSECYRTKYSFDTLGRISNTFPYNPQKQDIIILGDSYIEALMVENKNILHNQLSGKYQHKYNFLNYGLSGASPVQEFVILKEKVDLSNTKAILQFINLDSDLYDVNQKNLGPLARPKVFFNVQSAGDYTIVYPHAKRFKDTFIDFLGNFELYVFTKKAIMLLREAIIQKKSIIQDKSFQKPQDMSKNWLILQTALIETAKYINQSSSDISYIVIIASENGDNLTKIKNIFREAHIQYIILNEQNIPLTGFSCDSHWNDETHRNIASYIYHQGIIK